MSTEIFEYNSRGYKILIFITFVIGLMLDILNLTAVNSLIVPPFSLLFVLFWAGRFFDKTFIASAFILGICHDVLFQSLLGSHALIFSFITFLLLRNRVHFRAYSIPQQSFFVFGLLIIYQILAFFIFSPSLNDETLWQFLAMPGLAIIVWMILAAFLSVITSLKRSTDS